jgi:RNA polymerase sigma factor (sigma-70 family)
VRKTPESGRPLRRQRAPQTAWTDKRLVRACLAGNEEAWPVLIDRYKKLIYSIPLKYGARPEDAADIFQSVWIEVFTHLSDLREGAALRGWLATITAHQALRWKRRHQQRTDHEQIGVAEEALGMDLSLPSDATDEAEREQILRDATARLPPRCQEMIRMLFYIDPPLPYAEVARRLGLATGSIGFIRGRCLKRLQKNLTAMGF